ncbi:spore coat protein [Ureibacillus sp. 179-F W5.1 NHS]|uniref:Spore coat protein n=1 Tax=Lysinibacillus halotolerans TaxID=1368476 RepID=A0A3M8H527_9BACI|nr:spore coat protein [Lysinibacillus halotolerans]RNC97180.1 spore coat protein [Lysinibacillus halotolerans]
MKDPNAIPNKVVDLLVSEVLRKNGVNLENTKSKLTDEQKQSLKELVEDLKSQVDGFVNQSTTKKNN